MINTFEHNLAKWLDSLIKPYIPDRYSLPSTSSFIDKIKELNPTNDAKLISFDVTSFFTNIPVDLQLMILRINYSRVMSLLSYLLFRLRNQLRKTSTKNV